MAEERKKERKKEKFFLPCWKIVVERRPPTAFARPKKCEIAMEIRKVFNVYLIKYKSRVQFVLRRYGLCGFGNLSTHNFWVSDIYVT